MHHHQRAGVCVCAAGITLLCSSWAHSGSWKADNTGLRNLTVIGIGIAPSQPDVLYIQTRALGVYKSTDAGATWSKTATFNSDKGPGYDHLVHDGPAVHPLDAGIAWVASSGKVYKTTNGGTSWTLSSTGTTVNGCDAIHGIVIDPADATHLVAGTIIAGCDGGVFESLDSGATWTPLAGSAIGGGVGNDAWPIRIDPSNAARMYAGSPHNSIYRSIDGGHTWLSTPPVTGDHGTYAVAVNPLFTDEVWCAEVGATWRSQNAGATWVRQTQHFGNRDVTAIEFAPSDPRIAYAIVGDTIWYSSNNAATWTPRAALLGGPRCIAIDPADPAIIYVGTTGLGMYKSIDAGASFSEINTGLPMTQLIRGWQAFADPRDPAATFCVLDGNTVFRRPSDAEPWGYYGALPGTGLPYVQIDRYRPNRWYFADGGLWRSRDAGRSWTEIYRNNESTSVFDYWLDPRHRGRILLGDRDGRQVALSEDGGDTWTVLGTIPAFDGGMSGICGDSFDPDLILVAANPPNHAIGQNGYVWRSADRGQTWEHVRDRMFYGDWRHGGGHWILSNYAMRQNQPCCAGYHINLDHHTFGDGVYQCRIRIVSTDQDGTNYWAGFTIRTETADTSWIDSGWLVYMRRNGVVALHNHIDGTVINAEQTPVLADTSKWNTITLVATGNVLELYANDTLVGSYTDANHRFDAPGYFALQTNRAQADFDDLNIQAETTYTDGFDLPYHWGGYFGRWVVADPHTPGRFAYATQWGGLWYSADQGASWQRISDDDRAGYIYYRPMFATGYANNLYACSGLGYSWRVDNFYNDGASRQQVGQSLAGSTWLLGESPHNANRLFAALTDIGIATYTGGDIIGTPAPPLPVAMDFDEDGDVDLADFGFFLVCFNGPNRSVPFEGCLASDFDDDTDVDLADFSSFLVCFNGPSRPPACE